MALDPAVKNLIDTLNEAGLKSFDQMSIAQVRGVVESFSDLQAPNADVARVVDTVYPGPGGDQAVRLYIPESETPLPIVVYIHGGGWVAGSLDVTEQPCRALAADAKVIVAALSYRLAPEHKPCTRRCVRRTELGRRARSRLRWRRHARSRHG